jgi:hypothetical protein
MPRSSYSRTVRREYAKQLIAAAAHVNLNWPPLKVHEFPGDDGTGDAVIVETTRPPTSHEEVRMANFVEGFIAGWYEARKGVTP